MFLELIDKLTTDLSILSRQLFILSVVLYLTIKVKEVRWVLKKRNKG